MGLIEKIKGLVSIISEVVPVPTNPMLKNRFILSIEEDLSKISLSLTDANVLANKAIMMAYAHIWDKCVQQISNPVKSIVLNPVKYSDLYDYIDSFQSCRFVDVTFAIIDYKIIELIKAWLNLVYDSGFGYYDEYASYKMKVKMIPYNFSDTMELPIEIGGIEFGDVYPVSVRFPELNQAQNKIYTVNVQFAFKTIKITSRL